MFEGDTVEGYDPDELYQQWKELDSEKKKSKENSFLGSGNAKKAESGTIKNRENQFR